MTQTIRITLDFGPMTLNAALFDSPITARFVAHLPCAIALERWGNELYGSIGIDLGEENPMPEIPDGGIAYTNKGNYLCLFFGQRPAWAVEYIGQIEKDDWKKLIGNTGCESVTIRLKHGVPGESGFGRRDP